MLYLSRLILSSLPLLSSPLLSSPLLFVLIFYPLVKEVELRRSLILMGPRRVGKTVMMYHTIQRLINDGVQPQNIIFISYWGDDGFLRKFQSLGVYSL